MIFRILERNYSVWANEKEYVLLKSICVVLYLNNCCLVPLKTFTLSLSGGIYGSVSVVHSILNGCIQSFVSPNSLVCRDKQYKNC